MKTSVKGNTLFIELPLAEEPKASSTGKTLIAGGTGGFVQTEATYKGRPLKLNVTATIKPG